MKLAWDASFLGLHAEPASASVRENWRERERETERQRERLLQAAAGAPLVQPNLARQGHPESLLSLYQQAGILPFLRASVSLTRPQHLALPRLCSSFACQCSGLHGLSEGRSGCVWNLSAKSAWEIEATNLWGLYMSIEPSLGAPHTQPTPHISPKAVTELVARYNILKTDL